MGWWTPLSYWAALCEDNWNCNNCNKTRNKVNHVVLGPGEGNEVTCSKCKKLMKRKAARAAKEATDDAKSRE